MSEWFKFEEISSMSGPRKMILAAILTQVLTLFMKVRDVDSYGVLSISADWSTHGTYWIGDSATTGWEVRPLAPLVLGYLFLMFASKKYHGAFWHKHGYKVAAALMLFFTTGGAPLRVFGGTVSCAAQIAAFVAAWQHSKSLKSQAAENPPPSPDTAPAAATDQAPVAKNSRTKRSAPPLADSTPAVQDEEPAAKKRRARKSPAPLSNTESGGRHEKPVAKESIASLPDNEPGVHDEKPKTSPPPLPTSESAGSEQKAVAKKKSPPPLPNSGSSVNAPKAVATIKQTVLDTEAGALAKIKKTVLDTEAGALNKIKKTALDTEAGDLTKKPAAKKSAPPLPNSTVAGPPEIETGANKSGPSAKPD